MVAGGARIVLAVAVAATTMASGASAATLHVDAGAAAAGDGTGWATAYRFLQDALAVASNPANGITEIRVAGGSYTPDTFEADPAGTGDRAATFQLINGVSVVGGFAGPGEPDPDARDIVLHSVTLTGDLLGNDGPPINGAENSYNVVTGDGTDATAVLDGFTITAGTGTGPIAGPFNWRRGGGMWISAGSPSIIDCTITGNFVMNDGAGVYITTGSSPTLLRCSITLNHSFQSGGGIYNTGASHPVLTDCTFQGNVCDAGNGGGLANVSDCNPTVTGCDFSGNFAGESGGGMHNEGNCSPVVTGCTFADNTTDEFNGAGLNNVSNSSPVITGCVFSGNSAGHTGGAVASFLNCNPTVVNCLFVGNSAADWGGAVRAGVSSGWTMVNCTFVANSATAGGAVSVGSQNVDSGGSTLISNCILWGNSAAQGSQIALIGNHPAALSVDHGDVQGGLAAAWVMAGATLNWGPGNMDTDPLFADAVAGDYRLAAGSPCIDSGDNGAVGPAVTTDLDANPRLADDGCTPDAGDPPGGGPFVDLGAYEFQQSSCDLDDDGIVGITDFLSLLGAWGPCPAPCPPSCPADFDDDCTVGITDFLMLLADWTK